MIPYRACVGISVDGNFVVERLFSSGLGNYFFSRLLSIEINRISHRGFISWRV